MGVTVLKHCKEAKIGNPAQHLKNLIDYILNPEKTEDGLWVGGNCSLQKEMIYQTMMNTKRKFGKLSGRQGYHFVISFRPGECSEELAYQIGKDFCNQFLNDYDHVYAVHNDHAHMHVHIVFNSVDRIEGRKYRYVDGDWEKIIQPITDELCEHYGLSKLVYEKKERLGKDYAEYRANKNQQLTKSQILKIDIDDAIQASESEEDFFQAMHDKGYHIREGYSKKREKKYWSFRLEGERRRNAAHRDYLLGIGYSRSDILLRLQKNVIPEIDFEYSKFPDQKMKIIKIPEQATRFQIGSIRRFNQAVLFRFLDTERSENIRVRRDLLRIDQLQTDCEYLLSNNIRDMDMLEQRLEDVRRSWHFLNRKVKEEAEAYSVLELETQPLLEEYKEIQNQLQSDQISDEEFENLSDRFEELKSNVAIGLIQEKQLCEAKKIAVNEERKILLRLKRSHDALMQIPNIKILTPGERPFLRKHQPERRTPNH